MSKYDDIEFNISDAIKANPEISDSEVAWHLSMEISDAMSSWFSKWAQENIYKKVFKKEISAPDAIDAIINGFGFNAGIMIKGICKGNRMNHEIAKTVFIHKMDEGLSIENKNNP